MFVIAPPIPTSTAGGGRSSRKPREGARDRDEGFLRDLGRSLTVQTEAFRVGDRPDVDAEAVEHVRAVTERELRAPATGVEHDERAVDGSETVPDG